MIPKKLHQIWLGYKPPPAHAMRTWKKSHPTWEYLLWDEYNLPEIQNRKLFDVFHGVYHAQADILRYELLYQFGGVYVDADSECIKPLDDLLECETQNFVVQENDHTPPLLMNSFLGARPNSNLFKDVIDELSKIDYQVIANEPRENLHNITWVLTGPAALSEVVWRDREKYSLEIYPGNYFASHGEPGVYGQHWLGTTKKLY